MSSQHEGLDFAIKVVESQYSDLSARYDTLNQKLGTYTAALAIVASVIVLFLQNILSADTNTLAYFGKIACATALPSLFFLLTVASLLFTIISLVLSLVRVFQGLTPLTLQQVDMEAYEIAMQERTVSAKKRYAMDLAAATKWNKEAIRNRFSLLYSINRWFLTLGITLVMLIASNAIFGTLK